MGRVGAVRAGITRASSCSGRAIRVGPPDEVVGTMECAS